jgi:hypothetical protein
MFVIYFHFYLFQNSLLAYSTYTRRCNAMYVKFQKELVHSGERMDFYLYVLRHKSCVLKLMRRRAPVDVQKPKNFKPNLISYAP